MGSAHWAQRGGGISRVATTKQDWGWSQAWEDSNSSAYLSLFGYLCGFHWDSGGGPEKASGGICPTFSMSNGRDTASLLPHPTH